MSKQPYLQIEDKHGAIASIYINKTDNKANYLKLKLRFGGKNTFGIGTKVISYVKGKKQFKEFVAFIKNGFKIK